MAKNKYKNKEIVFDWIKFDSQIEMKYYQYLLSVFGPNGKQMIKVQPKYIIQDKFSLRGETFRAIEYIADFEFVLPWNRIIVVDIKGMATEIAKIKRKMFLKRYPDFELQWITSFQWKFVDYFQNEKRKKENRKLRQNVNSQLI